MAVFNLPAPTQAYETILDSESGLTFISWDGNAWYLYQDNADNPIDFPEGTGTTTVASADSEVILRLIAEEAPDSDWVTAQIPTNTINRNDSDVGLLRSVRADYAGRGLDPEGLENRLDSDEARLTAVRLESVRQVNGQLPDPTTGNVAVSLTAISFGSVDDLEDAIEQKSISDGGVWIVTDDSDSDNNGKVFVYDSDDNKRVRVAPPDTTFNDLRYVLKTELPAVDSDVVETIVEREVDSEYIRANTIQRQVSSVDMQNVVRFINVNLNIGAGGTRMNLALEDSERSFVVEDDRHLAWDNVNHRFNNNTDGVLFVTANATVRWAGGANGDLGIFIGINDGTASQNERIGYYLRDAEAASAALGDVMSTSGSFILDSDESCYMQIYTENGIDLTTSGVHNAASIVLQTQRVQTFNVLT